MKKLFCFPLLFLFAFSLKAQTTIKGPVTIKSPVTIALAGTVVIVPAFVQGVPSGSCQAFSGTTATCTFSSSVTGGNTIIGGTNYFGGSSPTISGIADNCNTGATSNTYATVDTLSGVSTFWAHVGATTATCTVTITFTSALSQARIILHEVSGITATTPVDGHTIQAQTGPGTGTNAVTSGSITTASSGDYIFGFTTDTTSSPTVTAGTGYTIRETSSGNLSSEDQVQNSAGAIAATFTQPNSGDNFITAIVAFKHS